MSYETIRLDIADAVATITLNRPERLNAAPPQMFDEIRDILCGLQDMGARALLITGEGRAFCSGADLAGRDGEQSISGGARAHHALTNSYNPAMLALAQAPVPIVTAVNGAAAGIGCSLALAGDFVLAGKSAYFLQAFVNIGLVPDGGASWMLPRLVGKARATEMMLLGERLPAEKAESWGLIYKAVDDAVLIEEARLLAKRLAAGPTIALGLMRQGIADALQQDYAVAMAAEADRQNKAGD
ncbi:MAG: enoyl-CoA hydratase-related protein, partial [Sphingomonadaceae bacterium]